MHAPAKTRPVKAVRIYCPIAPESLRALLAGETIAFERDATLGTMLAIIRGPNPLGDFGLYTSVVEVAPGWELFTPGPFARPTLGAEGVSQVSPTAILTLYVADDTPDAVLDPVLDALMAAHPWEVPVIEIAQTRLLLRD